MTDKKLAIVATTWEYLLKKGLSQASIGELCRETKLSQSSLYYWFDNKDELWVSAGKYGLSKVVDALFLFTFNHTNDVEGYFKTLLDEAEKYKYELRLALQITTSPLYGERMREESNKFNFLYAEYSKKIMGIFKCTFLQAEVFIYSIISIVIDYAIWDDGEKTQMLLDNLYMRIAEKIDIVSNGKAQ